MNIVSIVGARPQFIKAAPVSSALGAAGHHECLIHTGQHYDYGMSQVFFDELGIPEPDVNLNVGSGTHGWQTGQMLMRIEEVLLVKKPDWVLVYGDTNSTIAGALAAVKLDIPVVHVEAGLRSFNRVMPEEYNRVLVDHCSRLLFCPTQTAVENLAVEGIIQGVYLVGDVMYDAILQFAEVARQNSTILQELGLKAKEYLLATVHRPANTDVVENLLSILTAFQEIDEEIIFSVHPRTQAKIAEIEGSWQGLRPNSGLKLRLIEPVSYLDMMMLEQSARVILTDSGGIQKEAYWFGVPCITLRNETEWVETVETGWNVLVGADREKIIQAISSLKTLDEHPDLYGDGKASVQCVRVLVKEC